MQVEATDLETPTPAPANGTPAGTPAAVEPAPAPENPNGNTPEGTDKDEEHRVPKGVQKRIDRLTREKYRLQAENEVLRGQRQPTAPAPVEQPAPKAPKMEDYATVEAYIEAVTDFKASALINQKEAERSQVSQQREAQNHQAKLAEGYSKQADEARRVYDDFDDITDNPDIIISDSMAQAILRSNNGADIAYYLGKNPAEADRLLNLDPYSVAIEIGKISAKIVRPSPKTTSSAPAPIEPVGARATPTADPDKMSTDEWLKWRNTQIKSRR